MKSSTDVPKYAGSLAARLEPARSVSAIVLRLASKLSHGFGGVGDHAFAVIFLPIPSGLGWRSTHLVGFKSKQVPKRFNFATNVAEADGAVVGRAVGDPRFHKMPNPAGDFVAAVGVTNF